MYNCETPTVDADAHAEVSADEHDDPSCSCDACELARARRESEARARDARVYGGLSPAARWLFGARWLDEGGTMQMLGMPELAQRAIGDVFDQLARIGDNGRERARPVYKVSADGSPGVTDAPPLTRRDALQLIQQAELAIDFARAQVDFLPRGEPANDNGRFRPGDPVMLAGEGDEEYTVIHELDDGEGVRIRGDDGETLIVNHRDVRAARAGAA